MSWAAYVGSALTCVLGLLALVSPVKVADALGLQPLGGLGLSEVRATYGGFFLAAGAAVLVMGYPANLVLGLAWAGAACARAATLVLRRSRQWRNVVGVAFEGLVAVLLLAP